MENLKFRPSYRKVYLGFVPVIRGPHWTQSVGPTFTNKHDAKEYAQKEIDHLMDSSEVGKW